MTKPKDHFSIKINSFISYNLCTTKQLRLNPKANVFHIFKDEFSIKLNNSCKTPILFFWSTDQRPEQNSAINNDFNRIAQ